MYLSEPNDLVPATFAGFFWFDFFSKATIVYIEGIKIRNELKKQCQPLVLLLIF